MSGASANAAARRRRGISQNTSNTSSFNSNISSPQIQKVPTLTVPQTLMFLDDRISKLEDKLSKSSQSMLDLNGNVDVSLIPNKISSLEEYVDTVHNQVDDVKMSLSELEEKISENVVSRLNSVVDSLSGVEKKIINNPEVVSKTDLEKQTVHVETMINSVVKDFKVEIGNINNHIVNLGFPKHEITGMKDLLMNIQNNYITLNDSLLKFKTEYDQQIAGLYEESGNEFTKTQVLSNQLLTIVEENEDEENEDEENEDEGQQQEQHNDQNEEQGEDEEQDEEQDDQEEKEETNKEEGSNIELEIKDKDETKQIKEEVSEVVNDELVKKLKTLSVVNGNETEVSESNN